MRTRNQLIALASVMLTQYEQRIISGHTDWPDDGIEVDSDIVVNGYERYLFELDSGMPDFGDDWPAVCMYIDQLISEHKTNDLVESIRIDAQRWSHDIALTNAAHMPGKI